MPLPTTRQGGWSDYGDFFKDYVGPLATYVARRFKIPLKRAEEIVMAFYAHDYAREEHSRLPSRYDRNRRFRALLATCIRRFAQDWLEKEARRTGVSFDEEHHTPHAGTAKDDSEQDADLLALDGTFAATQKLLDEARAAARLALTDERERSYLDAKWPKEPGALPVTDTQFELSEGLTPGKRKTIQRRVLSVLTSAVRDGLTRKGATRVRQAVVVEPDELVKAWLRIVMIAHDAVEDGNS